MSPIGDYERYLIPGSSGSDVSLAFFSRGSKDFLKFSAIHYKDLPLLQAEENDQPGFRFSGTGPVRKSGRA